MPILYHYMKVDFVEENLTNQRIKFSRIDDFNDKFECCPETTNDYLQRHPGIPLGEVARFDLEMVGRQIAPLVGVLCFCQRRNNYLLWSHYALKHTGVALGIEVNHPCFSKAVLNEPVSYDPQRPQVDWDDFASSQAKSVEYLRLFLRKKDAPWGYEEEHRVALLASDLQLDKGMLFLPLPTDALREVIFGEAIEPAERRKIVNLLDAHYPHVSRFEACRGARGYTLEVSPLN